MKTARFENPPRFTDGIGDLARGISRNWLIGIEETNPAILDMFRTRDKKPYRDMLPWSGEFAGKYLTGAHYIWRLTDDTELRDYISRFIDRLIDCIDLDGYIGCYQKNCRMTGAFSTSPDKLCETWDAWSHYHIMLGLLLWNDEDGFAPRCLVAAERIAGFFLSHFYGEGQPRLSDIGNTEMNLAPLHGFVLLYRATGKEEYLRFAAMAAEDTSAEHCGGDYINIAASGIEYYQCPKPRWESLHIIIGFAELYRATGEEKYRDTAVRLFYSMLKTDVHNTGAFSTEEMAVGTPYKRGNVELCCVVAFDALAWEVLRLTNDPAIADHLELSMYNAVAGSFAPDGSWSTYDTPMEGEKYANFVGIAFQCRPGSPRLNCCSANCARAVGSLADWAVAEDGDTLFINYYGNMHCRTADGTAVTVEGDYPASSSVKVKISNARRDVALRIPAWSRITTVTVNGKVHSAASGEYFTFTAEGDTVAELNLDFTPRVVRGEGDFEGKSCVYVGPVLYGYENSEYSRASLSDVAGYDEVEGYISFRVLAEQSKGSGMELKIRPDMRPAAVDGRLLLDVQPGVRLCDFRHLGIRGSGYTTWLNLTFSV